MISLIVSCIGAVVAAAGGGVLLARSFRAPRGELIAFSVALLGLLVSLGAQAAGHLTGFDPAMFRAMELGGQVIAPLAVIFGMSEVAAASAPVRFCARLYIPALAIVAVVILAIDPLAQAKFTKAWPDPQVFYQLVPGYVLMFAIGPLTAVVALVAAGAVLVRGSRPGWRDLRRAQLMAAVAALALAYPCLALLVRTEAGLHAPVTSEFAPLMLIAAALIWLAGLQTGRMDLSAVHHGGRGDDFGQPGSERQPQAASQWADDYGWPGEEPGDDRYRARDLDASYRDGTYPPDFATGDIGPRDYPSGEFGTGDFATGDFLAADLAAGLAGDDEPGNWADDRLAGDAGRGADRNTAERGAASRGAEPGREGLFGQIAIYTLLEDRVAEFDQLTERVVDQVRRQEPDTLVFIIHAVPSAPMQRILYEVYRSRDAYERHNRQPYVQQFTVDRRPYVLATNVIELGLQQAKVTPFPSVSELFGEPGYDTSGFERPDYLRDYGRTSGWSGGDREYR